MYKHDVGNEASGLERMLWGFQKFQMWETQNQKEAEVSC